MNSYKNLSTFTRTRSDELNGIAGSNYTSNNSSITAINPAISTTSINNNNNNVQTHNTFNGLGGSNTNNTNTTPSNNKMNNGVINISPVKTNNKNSGRAARDVITRTWSAPSNKLI